MSKKRFFNSLVAAMIACCATGMLSSCQGLIDAVVGNVDNPAPTTQPTNDAAQLKQGIWTEYDEALLTSGKYTEDELAQMPTVAMWIQGDKGYFFTYTAETVSETVEGQISYNKSANTGTITFPYIAGNPLSIQTVNFSMASDDVMQFEFTYEGEKVTGNCAWLCKDLSNWGTGDESGWEELLPYYQAIAETAGPDGSIDWSGSATVTVQDVDEEGNIVENEVTVTDLDKPLVWNDGASSRGGTRMVTAVIEGISAGLEIFTSLFEPDPMEEINAKLDAVLGKLDNVLQNQQIMMAKLDEINGRLIEIAQRMKQQATVDIFNNRTQTYYNPLKVQNISYFNKAFKLYNDNKSNLGSVKDKLGEYAKEWVGKNEEYINLTWNYIEYLKTVQHSSYGTGMAAIYDGLTFDKYPWEHLGTGDRQTYRANDMIMIAKCLFMINLYAAYGGGSDIKKEGIYNNYNEQKPKLKEFCEFKVTDPNKFLVCQIPGAHFIMHKEIQKYDYRGKDVQSRNLSRIFKEAPNVQKLGTEVVYRPEWHVAGSIKIENPKELMEKLILKDEIEAVYKYYQSVVYPNEKNIWWYNTLVEGNDIAGGAVYSQKPAEGKYASPTLLLSSKNKSDMGMDYMTSPRISPVTTKYNAPNTIFMGELFNSMFETALMWKDYDSDYEYYAAIVEKRY